MITLKQLYNIALLRLENHNLKGAESLFLQILSSSPSDAFAKHQLAKIALEQNQIDRARELLVNVSAILGDDVEVLIDLGRAHTLADNSADAITCLERACTLAPQNSEAYRYLAEAFFAIGRFGEAAHQAEKSIFLSPNNAEAHSVLGDALLEQGHVQQALRSYDDSTTLNPDSWKVHANRGIGYMKLGDLEQAKQCLLLANVLNPMQPVVVLPLVSVLITLGQYNDAQLLLERLRAILPGDARVQISIGENALAQGNTKAAIAAFIKAISIDDGDINMQFKLALALSLDGKLSNAVSAYSQILAKNSTAFPAYVEKARLQLLSAEYQAGFESFVQMHQELRTYKGESRLVDENLDSKTVLLHSGTTLDDFNVLVRFAKVLKERGATVIVECTKPILSLVQQMACVDTVVELGSELPTADYRVPLECLPFILNIPAVEFSTAPYLAPRKALLSTWQKKFSEINGLKVGLMWQKETDVIPNIYHSVPLNAFSPLFEIENIHFVSLGTHAGLAQLNDFPHRDRLQRVGLENAFFEERIACVAALDLLITPDTLTGQVACAAGLPTWFLLGKVPHWQYGLENTQSVWHSTAKLFRQAVWGNFDDVMKDVAAALSALVFEKLSR